MPSRGPGRDGPMIGRAAPQLDLRSPESAARFRPSMIRRRAAPALSEPCGTSCGRRAERARCAAGGRVPRQAHRTPACSRSSSAASCSRSPSWRWSRSSRSGCSTSPATRSAFMVGQDATLQERARLRARPRARPPCVRAVRALRRRCRARRIRPVAAAGALGLDAAEGTAAGDARAVDRRGAARAGDRHSARRLHGVAARHRGWRSCCSPRRSSASSLPTFLIGILLILVFAVHPRLAAVVRARRNGGARLVDDGASDPERIEGADPAGDHAVAVPDDADHAAGACGDARGAAHRLHQVRARARA